MVFLFLDTVLISRCKNVLESRGKKITVNSSLVLLYVYT